MEEMKEIHEASQSKVQGAQAEDGENRDGATAPTGMEREETYRVFRARMLSITMSPTTCRLAALHLSGVSWVVW